MPVSVAIVCPLLGLLSPFWFCDAVRNYSKKKRLLEQYHTSGIQTTGIILQLQTTIHRSSIGGGERGRSHQILYCYKMEPSGNLCVKSVALNREPTSRRIPVLVLPGLEKSGLLRETVDNREWSYGTFKCVGLAILLLAAHLLGMTILFAFVFCWDENSCQGDGDSNYWTAFLGTVTLLMIVAFFTANWSYNSWKNEILHGGRVLERRSARTRLNQMLPSDVPTAEILAVMDGDDVENGAEAGDTTNWSNAPPVEARAVPTPLFHSSNNYNSTAESTPPALVAEATVVKDSHTLSWYNAKADDDQTETIRDAMERNDWMALRDFFAAIRGQHTERSFYMCVIEDALEETWKSRRSTDGSDNDAESRSEQFSQTLDDWIVAEPNNTDVCVIRGRCYTRWAWNARGSGYANTVDKDAWPKFFSRIHQAEAELNHAMELDPSDALVYGTLVTVNMAKKGRHKEEVDILRSKLALSDDPNEFSAHTRLLQFYCRKWGGSDDAMFQFARDTIKRLPDGDPLHILIVQAHYEAYLGIMSVAHATRNRMAIAAAVTYWQRPNVKQEILRSYRHYIGSSATVTVTAAQKSSLMTARNWYAYCLARTGEMEMTRRELLLIGRHPTKRPWNTLDQYQEACNKAGVRL